MAGESSYDAAKEKLLNALMELKPEASSEVEFRQSLDSYFDGFANSYVLDFCVDRVGDVLLHQKLLVEATNSVKKPSVSVRFVEDSSELKSSHEITICTIDKFRTKIPELLSGLGLNIRDNKHILSTTNGYYLGFFVVDGWAAREIEGLHAAVKQAIELEAQRQETKKSQDSYGKDSQSHELLIATIDKRRRKKKKEAPIMQQAKLCPSVLDDVHCTWKQCKYAHHVKELHLKVQPLQENYKTKICSLYTSGRCHMGEACLDTHGSTAEAERNGGTCHLFIKTGRCYFPDSCPIMKHPGAEKAVGSMPNCSGGAL